MEQLTKQQIVLVTLLVSFVTSIATGIVTVSLMDQAPPGVTQTINRVVERTIEKVTPAPSQAASVATKETVVVKEDDLVVQAVDKVSKSIVAIYAVTGEGDGKTEKFVGNGLIVGKDDLIATDAAVAVTAFDDAGNAIAQTFKAVFPDGTAAPIILVSLAAPQGGAATPDIILLKPKLDASTKLPMLAPATLADAASLKLGQAVVAMGGEKISVATGIVSNLPDGSAAPVAGAASSTSAISGSQIIKTDIHAIGKISGSVLVNLSGSVVGIHTVSAGTGDNVFIPANLIDKLI